jgi:ankyrin repeat protein
MSNYETYRKRNPPRVTGTCEWFLAHEQYLRWRNEFSSSLLWVSADPGCGKSVLASFLVEDLRRNKSPAGLPELICHFFFKDDSEDQRSAIFALRAILHQIFSDDRARQFHAFEAYEAKGEAIFNDFASLWEIFMAIAEDPESTNIIVVLDGLDECEIISQRQLLDALAALYTENLKWMIEKPFLKIVITSRPDNLIKNKFVKLPTIRLRGEDETEAISKDVELVIQDHVKELVQQGLPRSILDDLQAYLVKGADRTFLWTTLMIQLLKDASAEGASKSELQKILESRDIYAIYNKLLQKSSNASQARKMLRIILAATRPLTIDEMNIALAIMPSHRGSTELEAELRFPCENYLKSLCGHFIRIIRSNIYLVHQTAREFLLQQEVGEAPLPIGLWQHSMLMHESQQVLLDICVLYLFLHEPEKGKNAQSLVTASKRKKLFLEYVNEGNFLDYTAKQWPVHFNLSAVETDGERMNKCLRLCDPEFPGFYNWMRFHPGFLLDKSRWDNLLRPELQLHVATLLSLEPMVSRLLSGVPLNVNACDRNQRTALHLAAEVQSLGIVKLLLKEAKINVNATDDDKYTPLHIAVKQGSLEITKTLLEHGAEVDREDYMSNSALHLAVTVQSMNIVELLLQHDANVNAQNKHEITPLHLATKAQLLGISKLLLDNGANVNAKDQYTRSTALHQAAEQGDYDQINMILDYNPDINMTNSRGETPIKILRRQPTLNPEGLLRMKPADDDEDSDKASSSYGKEADSSSRHSKDETSVDSNASNHSSPVRGNARAYTFNAEPKQPLRRPTTAKAVKKPKPKGSWRKQIKSIFH